MLRKNFNLILKSTKLIAPQVRHLQFECEDGMPFHFVPGQFITLHIPSEGKTLRRSYSVANTYHDDSNNVEFAASYVEGGVASKLLFEMQPGDKVSATGPFGRLVLRDEHPARYILVATGTGVTPYRSMLAEIEKRFKEQKDLEVILLFGVRKSEDLLYGQEFVAFAEKNSRFKFRAYYSRVYPDNPSPYEFSGYVLNAFSEINPNPHQDIIYLCGNPNMIDEVFALLVGHGFATENIRREKYISSN